MKYGLIAERDLPETDMEKAEAIIEMVTELMERMIPVFDTTTFIIHEAGRKLTVGMKWEQPN